MSRRISQREARRMRAELEDLRQQRDATRRWCGDYWPGGVEVARVDCGTIPTVPMAVRTARKLGHAVVAIVDDGHVIRFTALPLPKAS